MLIFESFAKTMFDKMKGTNKKFEIKPSPEALAATNQVVAAEIRNMPNVVQKQPSQQQPVISQPKR